LERDSVSDLLEFRHFRYLIAVAEEQNITRAAKRLFVAQPSLSAQIKSMEESLLVDLLVRAPKGIKLTPAAEVLTAGARQILALRDDVIAAARASHNVSIAPLRIGFSPFVDRALLQLVCGAHIPLPAATQWEIAEETAQVTISATEVLLTGTTWSRTWE
jgi:DNA-binding transcriptional LysR family regulator